MDAKVIHGLYCKYSAGRYSRNADVVRRALKYNVIPPILGLMGIDRGDGKNLMVFEFPFFVVKVFAALPLV